MRMPRYSKHSSEQLSTATYNLQRLFKIVVAFYDNTIIQGWRSDAMQARLYKTGASKLIHGKHNEKPSQAVDSAPYLLRFGVPWPSMPKDWSNKEQVNRYIKNLNQFYHYAGFVQGVAANEGIEIRWGGDWDRDHDVTDQDFNDLVHFEEILSNGDGEHSTET